MYAPAKDTSIAILNDPEQLEEFDGVLFGIPTRYGNFPAQYKSTYALPSTFLYASTLADTLQQPSGTRAASNGLKAPSGASTPACSSPPARRVVARRAPPFRA
jgi:hypothetical protein